VRKHQGIDGGQTPAEAAGLEEKRWTLRDVAEMTDAYWQPSYTAGAARKTAHKRAVADQEFLKALAGLERAGMGFNRQRRWLAQRERNQSFLNVARMPGSVTEAFQPC